MTAGQATELGRQQHDHANAGASSRTEDAHYDAACGFCLGHGLWPGGAGDEDLAGY